MATLRERLKKEVSPSLVYPFLKSLEQQGYLKHTSKPVGEKQRKVYELTGEGKELCHRLFERFAGMVVTATEPCVNACAHCGCGVYQGGHLKEEKGETTFFAENTAPSTTRAR